MKRVALKGLLGRKTRAILTAFAIVLGVAMVSGTLVLTDTINRAFHTVFSSSYAHTDLVVSGKKLVDNSASGNATIPASLVAKVRALPDVQEAAGTIIEITAADLAQTSFVAGTVGDSLQIRAFDGYACCAPDTSSWAPFHVTV